MPFSSSFSESFNTKPISLTEYRQMFDQLMGSWDITTLKEEFMELGIWPFGE